MAKGSAAEKIVTPSGDLTVFESKLVSLLALMLVQERQQFDQIDLLSRAGFRPVDIATLLDTTANNVNVRLSERRKEKKVGKGKRPKKK